MLFVLTGCFCNSQLCDSFLSGVVWEQTQRCRLSRICITICTKAHKRFSMVLGLLCVFVQETVFLYDVPCMDRSLHNEAQE
jgi:hypothetical protein